MPICARVSVCVYVCVSDERVLACIHYFCDFVAFAERQPTASNPVTLFSGVCFFCSAMFCVFSPPFELFASAFSVLALFADSLSSLSYCSDMMCVRVGRTGCRCQLVDVDVSALVLVLTLALSHVLVLVFGLGLIFCFAFF